MIRARSRTGGHHLGIEQGLDHVAKKGSKVGFPRKETQPCECPKKGTGTLLDEVLTGGLESKTSDPSESKNLA